MGMFDDLILYQIKGSYVVYAQPLIDCSPRQLILQHSFRHLSRLLLHPSRCWRTTSPRYGLILLPRPGQFHLAFRTFFRILYVALSKLDEPLVLFVGALFLLGSSQVSAHSVPIDELFMSQKSFQ